MVRKPLGMVPFLINLIYTWNYNGCLLGISPFKALFGVVKQQGALHPKGSAILPYDKKKCPKRFLFLIVDILGAGCWGYLLDKFHPFRSDIGILNPNQMNGRLESVGLRHGKLLLEPNRRICEHFICHGCPP